MDQTRHIKQLDQIADLLHENARLRALVAKRERQLIEAVTGGIWFDNLSDEVARSTDDGVRRIGVVGFISDASLLAAVDEATGEK